MTTLLSLGLVPTWLNVAYDVKMDIMNLEGKVIHSYVRQAKLTEWTHLLLVFVHPLYNRFYGEEELIGACVKNILEQIQDEKALKIQPKIIAEPAK